MIIDEILKNITILVIKLIDMGGVNNNLKPAAMTPLYFNNPNRIDTSTKKVDIKNDDECYKNEIY